MKRGIGLMMMVFLLTAIILPVKAESEADYSISLMTGWKAKTADDVKKLQYIFCKTSFDDSSWKDAEINEEQPPYEDRYILYRRWVEIPASWKGKRAKILFGGVDDNAVVYLNGKKVGEHEGWDQPFGVDVTDSLKASGKNLIAVLCDNSAGGEGGIYGYVSVTLVDELEKLRARKRAELKAEVKNMRSRIVFETFRNNNWDLFMVDADGSNPVNITNTPKVNELYPHVSPDGKKVCFVVDEGEGDSKTRNVYYMNIDGTGRHKVDDNARQPCWSPDGSVIAYLKGQFEEFSYLDYATKGIFFYSLKTGRRTQHPNHKLSNLYNICWSPDGKWFVSTVHAGMGYGHAILAIEALGTGVFDLGISGCRPDISPDGKKIAWGESDWVLASGDLNLKLPKPTVTNIHTVVESKRPMKVYHVDWSPDGKYIAFSRGPIKKKSLGMALEIVGIRARGWNICIADAADENKWMPIMDDGLSNKEPDWVPQQ